MKMSFPTRTLKTVTLGCRVNQYETEFVRQGLARLGYRGARDGEPVDLCLINTCTVTAESEAKSRKIVRRLARQHPEAEIVVMGCCVARAAADMAALPGVIETITDKRELPDWLLRRGLDARPTGLSHFPSRRRAYVKVQDGCRGQCSYCIIPQVRPYRLSRPVEDVLEEVRRLIARGHREIVLTGIHLGDYGKDDEATARDEPLADLVRRIADLDGAFRIRLSSIEAGEVGPELLALMAERPDRLCAHLHLPLQSGSNAVLRRMNRRPVEAFIERCRAIRAAVARPALTTDVRVGFPGETEADFDATCRVGEELGFAKVHGFRFSPRPGTPAAAMPGQVANRIAQRRAEELGALGGRLANRYARELLGRRVQVLVESPAPDRPGWMQGTGDRYVSVIVPGGRELIGQFVETVAKRVENGRIAGEVYSPTYSRSAM